MTTLKTAVYQTRETVNEFIRRKGTNRGRIKAKSPEDRVSKWKTHFSNLLGQPPSVTIKPTASIIHEPLSINTDNITMEELVKSIKGFKNNKAHGLDNIPIEEAGTKVGPDQLGPPVRVGSTRIDSDQLGSNKKNKNKIKLDSDQQKIS